MTAAMFVNANLRALLMGAALIAAVDLSGAEQRPVRAPSSWVDQKLIDAAPPNAWLTHGYDYAETRASPLRGITKGNVSELGLAWYFDTGTRRGLEATPLVMDGVIYSTLDWSEVIANDARTGELLWRFDPQVPRAWGANACCDVVNRGLAAWGDALYLGTLDGRLIALQRRTGEVIWEVLTIDPDRPYTITGAPRAINGKIVIGNGGAEYGVRGYVTAYDADSGDEIWRFYTVPGDPALPPESPLMDMAADTWTGDLYYKSGGGGTVWDSMAYDPNLNFLYIGVGNGSPWNRWVRSPQGGDNLFLSSIVALDADTGAYRWHYQTTPGDTWDYTATQHMILAELEVRGQQRRVLMQAPKNGFFYVIDRATGELLAADNYVPVTWASRVDLESGRPVETENADHRAQRQTTSPASVGGHNWQPMAYNAEAGLVYIPALEAAQEFSTPALYQPADSPHWNLGQAEGASKAMALGGIPQALVEGALKHLVRGTLIAWDPVSQTKRWHVRHDTPWNGGVLTTASGLLFQGTGDHRLVAYDASSGERLWETPTGTGVVAPPVTFEVDGDQYLAVLAGWGGIGGLMMPRFEAPSGGNRLLVYRLGGQGRLPAIQTPPRMTSAPPPSVASKAAIVRGEGLYMEYCSRCHGPNVGVANVVRDLRYMSDATHQLFEPIVLEGIYAGLGMVSFADHLSAQQVRDIHDYLTEAANQTWEYQEQSGWWHDVTQRLLQDVGELAGKLMGPP